MAGRAARFGGWRVDLKSGEIIWSDETAAIHEVPNRPGKVENGLEFYIPEHRPIMEAAFQRCVNEGVPFDLILRILTGKGREIWVRAIGEPERDESAEIVGAWGAFQDVDELVAAHERSEAMQQRLAETLNGISEGFMVLDEDWNLTFLNHAGAKFLLRTHQELVGRNIWEEFPEARGSQFEISYRKAFESGQTVAFEEYYAPLERWFEVRAHPTSEGLAVHFQDVTERRRSHEALRLSEERFRHVTKVTNDVIWDWNLSDDTIWCNENMALKFGHSSEVSGEPGFWSSQIHSDDRARVMAGIDAAVRDGREWSDEYRFLKADGSVAHVIDRGLVIRDASGAARRMVGSMSDVTSRIGMEAQLREAQKLEAVGQLTGGVAHDFNNLLTVIIGAAESLSERLGHDAESVMLAEMTTAAAQRGAELTSRLLAFSRQQPLEPKATNVGHLVADFDPILRRTLSEDIDLEVVRGGGLWAAMVDPGQLETALLNLAINARDAMPSGGRLTIETGNVSLDEEYARTNEEVTAGQYVMVSVSDTGTGMPPEIVSRAFEPFFTTKEVGKGSGLGLSMVYGFAKQSRGHVKIYSELGEGTTIRLYLPRAYANQPATEAAGTTSAHLATGEERILVVEDDPMVREHVARQLRGLGYQVTEAADGQQALTRLKDGERFDLLFTDVVMPGGMNGRDLAVAAKDLCAELKVLFTSGYTENAIVHHGRLDPGVQLLSKPYRKRDLAERVRRILDA
jgi:PAS domain S-box-containing protein